MQVVTAFGHAQIAMATNLYAWIKELDGVLTGHACLLVTDRTVSGQEAAPVMKLADEIFGQVQTIRPSTPTPDGWPQAPNLMFQTAASWAHANGKKPFLWLETDAVPVKAGWLTDLELEYMRSKKKFMGVYEGKPWPHLTGTAIWSGDTKQNSISRDTFAAGRNPFDCMVRPNDRDIHITRQIQHVWDLMPFDEPGHLAGIQPGTVLFHRNKDHKLIGLLRQQRNGGAREPEVVVLSEPEPRPKAKPEPKSEPEAPPPATPFLRQGHECAKDLTIVITSHQRPELLISALKSCLDAGVENVVITATGVNDAMRQKFMEASALAPAVRILTHGDGVTSNESWRLGVEAAGTRYVGILHDDDLLLPDYLKHMSSGIEQEANIIVTQAENHECTPYLCSVDQRHGKTPTDIIKGIVTKKGGLSISPIRALFRKGDLARWLRVADGLPSSCYYRPDFLVGNDLLIWLQACDEYKEFWNVPHPAVSHGHWGCSTTVQDLAKESRLFGMYDTTREWYAQISDLPLHIVTIVLDGMPFITQHLPILNQLKIPWHWHIVEGAAMNTHCTKWCNPQDPRLSSDGTTEYIDQIKRHPRISVYRKKQWDGKQEMVNAPLENIDNPCILMQIDSDEIWTADQLTGVRDLFKAHPEKGHAMFWCRYFFGPHIVMTTTGCYGNSETQDWKRAWRYSPGMRFSRHEPPTIKGEGDPIPQAATAEADLVFDHYGYAFEKQVQYKQDFYGKRYEKAVAEWSIMQRKRKPFKLSKALTWVNDEKAVAGIITEG